MFRSQVLFGAAVAGLAVSLAGCAPVGYGGYYGGYGYPYYGGYYGYGWPYYGGYYGYDPSAAGYANGYAPGSSDDGSQSGPGLPSVVINQNFVPPQSNPLVREYGPSDGSGDQPSSLKMYQAPTPGQMTTQAQQPTNSDQATLYLIAFRDRTIVQALGYWMEGATLHYVTVDHDVNQVSLDLIDRDLSQRLNGERGVEFRLPPPR